MCLRSKHSVHPAAVTRSGSQRGEAGEAGEAREAGEAACSLVAEYVARASRLAPLFPRLRPLPADLAYESPRTLAAELHDSILYESRPYESLNRDFDDDSLA
ncbi:unnamed protein product [Euphydryas editha]|uniref:Uncharacterized protein n=1 Tax=Euphydryas editha TaxID=104508 RepID=A0AAU9VET4_EUPED|nr:unnamed protein product [Euphydryas editha]